MEEDSELAGTLYVDGHVRVYNGNKTSPERFECHSHLPGGWSQKNIETAGICYKTLAVV